MRKDLYKALTQPQKNRLKANEAIIPPEWSDDPDLNCAYLNRKAIGRQVRLEFELLTVEDIRWMAVELSDISRSLSAIAWESDEPPLTKVLRARMTLARGKRTAPRKRARKPRKSIAEVVRGVAQKK